MFHYLLLLVPLPALGGFVLLALDPYKLDRRAVIAAAVVAGAMPLLLLLPLTLTCYLTNLCGDRVAQIFSLEVGEYEVAMALGLDEISAVAGLTVTFISACVMTYSVQYMSHASTADLRRFFALMNLFVAGMLAMVLAADSVVLFLGWELMGLCSFFLIAYNMNSNRAFVAGQKAFIITRIGDATLLAGLLLLFLEAGTIRLEVLIPTGAATTGAFGGLMAFFLLVGALSKSAQLPFQTWLPTAMAGPTPVSALLHSATMVAAGAILLVRFAPVFQAQPFVSGIVAMAGASTALFGSACALAQLDVKRLLAYSSISQIGMMVLAVGVGAPEVALAHFVIHAIFKSMLFMSAGTMAQGGGGSTAIADLRGARLRTPISYWTFTVGAATLAAFPIITAGWWSKEAILGAAFHDGPFGVALWAVGIVAAVLTGAYAFRPVFVGATLSKGKRAGLRAPETIYAAGPLIVLAVLSVLGGLFVGPIVAFLGGTIPHPPLAVAVVGALAAASGLGLSYAFTFDRKFARWIRRSRSLRAGLQMDARYYLIFVRPYRRLVRRLAGTEGGKRRPIGETLELGDPIGDFVVNLGLRLRHVVFEPFLPDRFDTSIMRASGGLMNAARRARRFQTGRVRDYILALTIGMATLLILAWGHL
jgi:NADH-quinone oxidoreductase subunit L